MAQGVVTIDGNRLTVEEVIRVAGRKDVRVELAHEAIESLQRSRAFVDAAQALDFRKPLEPGVGTRAAYGAIRARVPFLDRDRILYHDMDAAAEIVRSGALVAAVEAAVGPLR